MSMKELGVLKNGSPRSWDDERSSPLAETTGSKRTQVPLGEPPLCCTSESTSTQSNSPFPFAMKMDRSAFDVRCLLNRNVALSSLPNSSSRRLPKVATSPSLKFADSMIGSWPCYPSSDAPKPSSFNLPRSQRSKTDRRDAHSLSELLWTNRDRLRDGLLIAGARQVVLPSDHHAESQRITLLRKDAGRSEPNPPTASNIFCDDTTSVADAYQNIPQC